MTEEDEAVERETPEMANEPILPPDEPIKTGLDVKGPSPEPIPVAEEVAAVSNEPILPPPEPIKTGLPKAGPTPDSVDLAPDEGPDNSCGSAR